jgi:bacterioferritin-associated ferredoxin
VVDRVGFELENNRDITGNLFFKKFICCQNRLPIMSSCPCCNHKGFPVEKVTVIIHSKEEVWPISDEKYYYCPEPTCRVVYYTKTGKVIKKDMIKSRVTFKENEYPRPLCYCKMVTEEDVMKAIERGAKTFDEVVEATGIGGGGFCTYTNPQGRCCSRNYVPFIENKLKESSKQSK